MKDTSQDKHFSTSCLQQTDSEETLTLTNRKKNWENFTETNDNVSIYKDEKKAMYLNWIDARGEKIIMHFSKWINSINPKIKKHVKSGRR